MDNVSPSADTTGADMCTSPPPAADGGDAGQPSATPAPASAPASADQATNGDSSASSANPQASPPATQAADQTGGGSSSFDAGGGGSSWDDASDATAGSGPGNASPPSSNTTSAGQPPAPALAPDPANADQAANASNSTSPTDAQGAGSPAGQSADQSDSMCSLPDTHLDWAHHFCGIDPTAASQSTDGGDVSVPGDTTLPSVTPSATGYAGAGTAPDATQSSAAEGGSDQSSNGQSSPGGPTQTDAGAADAGMSGVTPNGSGYSAAGTSPNASESAQTGTQSQGPDGSATVPPWMIEAAQGRTEPATPGGNLALPMGPDPGPPNPAPSWMIDDVRRRADSPAGTPIDNGSLVQPGGNLIDPPPDNYSWIPERPLLTPNPAQPADTGEAIRQGTPEEFEQARKQREELVRRKERGEFLTELEYEGAGLSKEEAIRKVQENLAIEREQEIEKVE